MGRKCAVPNCYTGYRKCTDKAALYKVPDDDYFLNKWNETIAREDRPITPRDYVCEKHFKEDDILRKRIRKDVLEVYQRPRLKPDAIPTIFPDLPEFILKMTKKRRKLDVPFPNNNFIDLSVENSNEAKLGDIKEEREEESNEININNDEISIKTETEETVNSKDGGDEYDSTGAKLYTCDKCSYKTKFSHNLRTHKVKHLSGEEAYMSCHLCLNYKTKWELTYVNHMKCKHGIVLKEYFKCTFCMFKTKNKDFFKQHFENEHDKKVILFRELKCVFEGCDYTTQSEEDLNVHNITHTQAILSPSQNIRTFTCKKCVFKSNCKGTLMTHIKNSHNDDEAEKCSNVKNNEPEIVQNIVKPAKLPHLTISDLSKNDKQTLKCSRCPYRTHSEALLKKHLVKHQMLTSTPQVTLDRKKETYCCSECSHTTKNKPEHLKHTLTHRNTSVEVVQSTSKATSCSSSIQNSSGPDFCVVTIKEDDLFIEGS